MNKRTKLSCTALFSLSLIGSSFALVTFAQEGLSKAPSEPQRANSFIVYQPVSYIPNYVETKREAFLLQEFSFDTRGESGNTTSMAVSYTSGKTVDWTISGGVEGKTEFSVIALTVEATANIQVARTASTTSSIGASKTYNLYTGKSGYVRIYAHGQRTSGAIKYKWTDVSGRTGYTTKTILSTLPYSTYGPSGIHFGSVTYY